MNSLNDDEYYVRVGENPSKRKLQGLIYHRFFKAVKSPARILCMPGASCWDIEYMLAHYAHKVSVIHAVEFNKGAADIIRARFSGDARVSVFAGTVLEFIAECSYKIDLAYLDYTSNFNLHVEFDLHMLFTRKLMNTHGRIVVSTWAAHETSDFRIRYAAHIAEAGWEPPAAEARCVAFNAFVLAHGRHIRTRPPSWYRYRTGAAHMYTADMVVCGTGFDALRTYATRYVAKDGSVHNYTGKYFRPLTEERGKTEAWEHPKVETVVAKNFRGMRISPQRRLAAAVAIIHKFRVEHKRTPSIAETGLKPVLHNRAIRASDACPRVRATPEQLLAEAVRVRAAHGYVDWQVLGDAHLSSRIYPKTALREQVQAMIVEDTGHANTGLAYRKYPAYFERLRMVYECLQQREHLDAAHRTFMRGAPWAELSRVYHRYLVVIHPARVKLGLEKAPVVAVIATPMPHGKVGKVRDCNGNARRQRLMLHIFNNDTWDINSAADASGFSARGITAAIVDLAKRGALGSHLPAIMQRLLVIAPPRNTRSAALRLIGVHALAA